MRLNIWMPNRNRRTISALKRKSLGITSGINASTSTQLKKINKTKIVNELPQVPLSNFYMRVDGIWENKGLACGLCGKLMNHETVIDKHRYICEVLNKVEEEEVMPIHRITRNGTTYYRYGTTGKEYRTLEEAQKQARAIQASQAREQKKK